MRAGYPLLFIYLIQSFFTAMSTRIFAAGCAAEAVVPADEVVIFGVDLREGGGVILALVPQVDLHIVSKLIALGAAHGRGRAQLVDVGGDQLHHRLHGAGGAGAGRGGRHLQKASPALPFSLTKRTECPAPGRRIEQVRGDVVEDAVALPGQEDAHTVPDVRVILYDHDGLHSL